MGRRYGCAPNFAVGTPLILRGIELKDALINSGEDVRARTRTLCADDCALLTVACTRIACLEDGLVNIRDAYLTSSADRLYGTVRGILGRYEWR